ncbi:4Fe-4S dicluster domain-containing protein [Desulfofundulus thermobenzoicus]|uniref:4Fe-4S dicluster domain-containing protein n=1 Tax=Desulfofundulus thermobenzoicus TaxID=29376 RepID=A0A6N7IR97_9FIRM|nr:4Fe-4S dicluster domain-containing protein [Desulfofundulus thermobenzoicus]MQL52562.1 4Fe-4S dicluster domain-containing protein [Desulfofundulus thermobenzoicus]HHW43159.1 4Fe-4S dicluster domain-containing protein [Desulfotomaculum sp.]
MVTVNPQFAKKLKKFGAKTATDCFNCGTCTAVCPLVTDENQFPRRFMRYVQLGMEDKIKHSLEPWLCYYCGDCQKNCPRQANPGEVMMSLRRYLTSLYDWTGLATKLYTSKVWEILSVVVLFIATLLVVNALHGPMVLEHTELETFAPRHVVDPAGWIFGGVLSIILLSNIYRMYRFVMDGGEKVKINIPLSVYVQELYTLIYNFLTQKRFSLCSNKSRWIKHWLLMSGYTVAFLLVNAGSKWFLTNEYLSVFHPARILGYYATIALLYVTTESIISRLRKTEPIHQYSHSTDWMFLILLWLTVFTGLLTHVFKYLDLPLATYYTFAIHLAFTVPLLGLEVPFTKWAHLAYRPFALYFKQVKERALEMQRTAGAAGQMEISG